MLEEFEKFIVQIKEQIKENKITEKDALEKIVNKISCVISDSKNSSNYHIYPNLVDDIDNVLSSYDELKSVELEEDDYNAIIDEILEYDYSDYNDYISEKILELTRGES